MPDVVVVAVTYNSATIVEPFLRSLPAALDGLDSAEVVIVDNASADGTADLVRQLAPWVVVIDAGDNLGYAAGINLGLRRTLPNKAVYVSNPDAIPSAGSLKRLIDAFDSFPDAGIVVPRILDSAGHLYHSLRREPTIPRALGAALLGGRRIARYASLSEVVVPARDYPTGTVADWATGAAMMISRTAIDAVGSWTEDFFLYSEETDYALRVRDHGLTLRYVADAVVVHAGGDMSVSSWLWGIQAVNRTRLYRRRHGRVASAAFWAAVALNEGVRALTGSTVHRAGLRAVVRGHPALREHRRRLDDRAQPVRGQHPHRNANA